MPASLLPEDYHSCLREVPRTVHTAAGPIEYAVRGEGEPLLALHGTPGGWDQGLVAAEFMRANGFRVIAPSRPGYLGTPLDTGRTPAQQGDALAALLDALGIDRIRVFAGSGGDLRATCSRRGIRTGSSGCSRSTRSACLCPDPYPSPGCPPETHSCGCSCGCSAMRPFPC